MIQYLDGDATQPLVRPALIAHVCNDAGKWGAGFSGALTRRWPFIEKTYRSAYRCVDLAEAFKLGQTQFVTIEADLHVANMIAQHGIRRGKGNEIPLRYNALDEAMQRVAAHALAWKMSVHMPRIGCDLAGGSWRLVEPIIEMRLLNRGIPVYVYTIGDTWRP